MKEKLKNILSVPTYTWEEDQLISYVTNILEEKGYPYYLDSLGSIYITKGKSEHYPCLVAHLDSVHQIKEYEVVEWVRFTLLRVNPNIIHVW